MLLAGLRVRPIFDGSYHCISGSRVGSFALASHFAGTPMTITDEMVEAAAKEFERHAWPDCPWESIHESGRERYRQAARDALTAAVLLHDQPTTATVPSRDRGGQA